MMQVEDAAAHVVMGHDRDDFQYDSARAVSSIIMEGNKLHTLVEQLMTAVANLGS